MASRRGKEETVHKALRRKMSRYELGAETQKVILERLGLGIWSTYKPGAGVSECKDGSFGCRGPASAWVATGVNV